MSTQNVNVARFARNVEWDFLVIFKHRAYRKVLQERLYYSRDMIFERTSSRSKVLLNWIPFNTWLEKIHTSSYRYPPTKSKTKVFFFFYIHEFEPLHLCQVKEREEIWENSWKTLVYPIKFAAALVSGQTCKSFMID